jgi:peptide/nickel transport system substrate-binding protein
MMDQETYLAWAIGPSQFYCTCPSVFACGSPYVTQVGAEPIIEHDLEKARQLVRESGYDGRPIVVLHPTDISFINAAVIVTRRRLESIGFKVILKPMDRSANLVVRARKEPPDKGGWNLLHTPFGWTGLKVQIATLLARAFCEPSRARCALFHAVSGS